MTVTHIVVATDGSPNGQLAVQWSGELAAQTQARVTVVHVFEPLAHLAGTGPVDLARLRDQVADELAGAWTKPLSEAGVAFDTAVVEGKPADAIADVAAQRGADLIVVGARGLTPMRRVVLGSTSQRLPHLSSIPVAVIPAADQ
jgi:nucleotide-binding universal stress UspA family protein